MEMDQKYWLPIGNMFCSAQKSRPQQNDKEQVVHRDFGQMALPKTRGTAPLNPLE
jgi:hypothetical protein